MVDYFKFSLLLTSYKVPPADILVCSAFSGGWSREETSSVIVLLAVKWLTIMNDTSESGYDDTEHWTWQWACYRKWKVDWEAEAQTRVCRWSTSTLDNSCGCMHCSGYAGVKGNDRADRLAGKATLTSSSLLGRSEVLRSLRHYLRVQSQGHHTIDRLEKRGVERGSARRSSLKRQESVIVNQTNVGTVSKAILEKLPRDGVERIWLFRAHRYHLELSWTEPDKSHTNVTRAMSRTWSANWWLSAFSCTEPRRLCKLQDYQTVLCVQTAGLPNCPPCANCRSAKLSSV